MARIPALLVASVLTLGLCAQAPPPFRNVLPETTDPAHPASKLVTEIQEKRQHLADLNTLSDTFGPRLTGSENLRHAQAWVMEKLKAYGAVNVREEAYDLGLAWSRGIEWGRLLGPNPRWIPLNQMAWTSATPGSVQGDLVVVDARSVEELAPWRGKLKGKIVLRTLPDDKRPGLPTLADSDVARAEGGRMGTWLLNEGAAAALAMSAKKDGLVLMRGGDGRDPAMPQVPTAIVAPEAYRMLFRLASSDTPQRLELSLGGTFSPKPVKAYNVVADLPGTDKADEAVILGGHFDSWDLATGTMDNGTGSMMAVEVLRAIQACGLKPRRTLRVVLWTGEEQGLLGARAHVASTDLSKIQAVLNQDTGSGWMRGLNLWGREDLRPAMAAVQSSVHDLGIKDLPLGNRRLGYSDHAPYGWAGIPSFVAMVDSADYGVIYHATTDTLDHLIPDQWTHMVQGMAVITWELLNMEQRLPHVAPIDKK